MLPAFLLSFFLLFVLELTVVDDLTDRWTRVGRDLDQIKSILVRYSESFRDGNDSQLAGVGTDYADFRRPDPPVKVDFLL